jgi:hypothetical protein
MGWLCLISHEKAVFCTGFEELKPANDNLPPEIPEEEIDNPMRAMM